MLFKDKYAFLSNFYPSQVTWGGVVWHNSEAAYQAAKCKNPQDRMQFVNMTSPVQAKRTGRLVECIENWDDIKVDVMLSVVNAKFSVVEMQQLLQTTGNLYLEEGNYHEDNIWGRSPPGNSKGRNLLGALS